MATTMYQTNDTSYSMKVHLIITLIVTIFKTFLSNVNKLKWNDHLGFVIAES